MTKEKHAANANPAECERHFTIIMAPITPIRRYLKTYHMYVAKKLTALRNFVVGLDVHVVSYYNIHVNIFVHFVLNVYIFLLTEVYNVITAF